MARRSNDEMKAANVIVKGLSPVIELKTKDVGFFEKSGGVLDIIIKSDELNATGYKAFAWTVAQFLGRPVDEKSSAPQYTLHAKIPTLHEKKSKAKHTISTNVTIEEIAEIEPKDFARSIRQKTYSRCIPNPMEK